MSEDNLTFSNPRTEFITDDWPSGRHRVTARFWIESGKRGERACRTTTHPKTGVECKPKKLTYAKRQRIVDGSDGRTYVLSMGEYGGITAYQSNLQFTVPDFYVTGDDERYKALADILYADQYSADPT